MSGRRFVLLDRDGTIIAEKNYLSDPAGVELIPGAKEALLRLREAGWGTAIISNQSGIGRGYYTELDAARVHARLLELLGDAAAVIGGAFYCPHAPERDCDCRKPKPALAERAACALGFDLRESWVVGDKDVDVELGRNAGARTILVRTGYGAKHAEEGSARPDYIAADLREAAEIILRESPSGCS